MAHGGSRPGAGKPKGSTNKALREAREKAAAGGLMPLDYLLEVMRNVTEDQSKRIDAAKAAAPYLHPKLANIEHAGPGGGPIQHSVEVVFVGEDDDSTSD